MTDEQRSIEPRDFRDRQAWEREQAARAQNAGKVQAVLERGLLRRAELAIEHLSGDEHFEFFLSLVQARFDESKGRLEALQLDDLLRLSYRPEELAELKARRQIERALTEQLGEILALPKLIREFGQEAAKQRFLHERATPEKPAP